MKGMKGKLLKKIKSIKPIGYLKPDRILHVNAADGFFESFSRGLSEKVEKTKLECEEAEQENICPGIETVEEPDIIDVAELMKDLEEEEEGMEADDGINDKENIGPPVNAKDSCSWKEKEEDFSKKTEPGFCTQTPLSEIDVFSFRRPDMNSGTLFDPNLLAAFEEAVNQHIRISQEERKARMKQENLEQNTEKAERNEEIEQENVEQKREKAERNEEIEQENVEKVEEEPPYKARRIQEEEEEEENTDPLLNFEQKCPPGGDGAVILYTTTLRGIRKTFEDCSSIRFLLESFRVIFFERDVSMHTEFKEELWRILDCKALPPRLFIKGRYIGGAAEVLTLHEQGKFRPLFEGIPIDRSDGPCEACAGVRFVLCHKCSGSHKVVADDGSSSKCQECNENGLIVCPLCC
ncbi:putative Glutaredoxin family protein [Melia azedarach]|uniref:Glutaredoxin family protein n=1 Tax=Melia azedarach TaxID=155640 RepID=A0ACC1YB60_MELAZ|nr:putative Glutaredoxin family protein [Melia azedarach]